MSTDTKRALPEKRRKARNLEEGYEVEVFDAADGSKTWQRITSHLYITSPIKVVRITVADGFAQAVHPDDEILSRRPAAAPVAGGSA